MPSTSRTSSSESQLRRLELADERERRRIERRHRAEIEERHELNAFLTAGSLSGQL